MSTRQFQARRAAAGLGFLFLGVTGWAILQPDFKQSTMVRLEGLSISGLRPMFASASSRVLTDSRPGTVVRPVSCEVLPGIPGKTITTAIVEFPPLSYSPAEENVVQFQKGHHNSDTRLDSAE